jgi:hypothetical protein
MKKMLFLTVFMFLGLLSFSQLSVTGFFKVQRQKELQLKVSFLLWQMAIMRLIL